MYQRALQGREKALRAEHALTLETVNNLGILYKDQGKLGEAEKIYQRARSRVIRALSVDLQGSWRFFSLFFSFTRILQLVQDPFSALLGFHSFDALYKSSRITLLSYLVSQLYTVISQPLFYNRHARSAQSPPRQLRWDGKRKKCDDGT
jgi:hypothetical protein